MADKSPVPPGGGVGGAPAGTATPTRPRVQVAPLPPETSASSVQTIMLGLGGLLLGIAAIVFVAVAITDLQPWSQLAILLAVAAAFLLAGPLAAVRGLGATAETLGAVGLVLVSVGGYPLWNTGALAALSPPVYIGLVAAATAATGYGYHQLTRLAGPRWVTVLAAQPVLPLLLSPELTGAAGWATVFAAVAIHNAALAALTRGRWLVLVTWGLHAAALIVALGYGVAALFLAETLTAAVPGALAILLAGAVAAASGLVTRQEPLAHLGAGILTLSVIVAAARLAALALPGQALLPTAAIMAAAAAAALALPREYRRGPQRASAWALTALGVVVVALALRAGYGAVVWPAWPSTLTGYPAQLASSVGSPPWELVATAAAATIGAGLSLPSTFRREVTVAGVTATALAAPASLGLAPQIGAWVMLVAAAALGLTGLSATTRRATLCHAAGAALVGLGAAGTSLAAPILTATILTALTVTGLVLAGARPRAPAAEPLTGLAAGAAVLALPGAAATSAAAANLGPTLVLAVSFTAVSASLSYAVFTQLRDRVVPLPIWAGAGLGTLAVVAATLLSDPGPAEIGIAVLLLLSAVLTSAGYGFEAIRRPYRRFDTADLAAAAVTVSVVVSLTRLSALSLPFTGSNAALTTAAALVTVVTLGVRVLPPEWRRGPVLGVTVIGTVVGAVAAAAAVVGGARALTATGPRWEADLSQWAPGPTVAGITWAAPLALTLLAIAAATVLPPPQRHHASAGLIALAAIGAPAGLGMPWWAPAALATVVGAVCALGAVAPSLIDLRTLRQVPPGAAGAAATASPGPLSPPVAPLGAAEAAWPRAFAAVTLAMYAVAVSLARPWLTAAVLGAITLTGAVVAALAIRRTRPDPRLRVGGVAVTGALLAGPGALLASTAQAGHGMEIGLPAALAGASLGLAVMAMLHMGLAPVPGRATEPALAPYLPYATVGVSAAATITALASLGTPLPTAVYAAAAVLLSVLAELVRAAEPSQLRQRRQRSAAGAAEATAGLTTPPTMVSPAVGALLAGAIPTGIALVAIAPALRSSLIDPYLTLQTVWQGPPTALLATAAVPATSVLAALLLTLAAALAAIGFGDAVARQAVPLTLPGLAVTILIAPAALNAPWPASTMAALSVFAIAMLGVALTPPPLPDRNARPLWVARRLVFWIGLAAGGAGLAGSLATPELTWGTFAGAVAVGAVAGMAGRTRHARLLGWLFAAVSAQVFALVTVELLGLPWSRAGFALLAVSAVSLLLVARLPRLRPPRAPQELAAVEVAGGYLPLVIAVGLAYSSPPDLATLLIGAGAVIGLAAVRAGRTHRERRILWWIAAISEVLAWWLLMQVFLVGLLEAYTLPFAALALAVGALENRYRPDLGSWVTYGPGLAAALVPSLLLVVTTGSPDPVRQIWVILAGVATLLLGSRLRQRAPLIIGSAVTAIAALHLLSLAGPWLILIPIGLLLLFLGANREKRQRDLERLRGAYSRMR
ncbi:permease [Natronosporangium hydrolyticum]|uniref:Permease n=1 Tax=Natronosporangium hydrolyticum TaxID=2811111 RepID=A0A895YET8_9ACTN|nr:permease [Natronosporangium hydrolyticum]QSB13919.1 permease [Natronosporangium hydrolyticum]